tara:strand:- start:17371 stop:17559 length:189 start_codon:yes stop_codon:yes gene_type:complete
LRYDFVSIVAEKKATIPPKSSRSIPTVHGFHPWLLLLNPDYVIEFVMSVAIARKSGCLEILA